MSKSLMPPKASKSSDDFQTPPTAVEILIPHLWKQCHIWEPAQGKGNIVWALRSAKFRVTGTDIKAGEDFFKISLPSDVDAIVTNPPFSCKDRFMARCYDLGLPWALLLPIAALGEQKRVGMYRRHGIQLLIPDRRIEFLTPSGQGSGAWQFHCWFTHGLDLKNDLTFATLPTDPAHDYRALAKRTAVNNGGLFADAETDGSL